MKVTQEKLDQSRIGLQIEVGGDQTTKYYEQAIKKLSSDANIPGFRKGKIPRQVILQRMGQSQIKAMAIEYLLDPSMRNAIKQESIPAIGNFQVTSSFDDLIVNYIPGQPLTFGATVDVLPEVELTSYMGMSVKAEEVAYDAAQVDDFIEQRRREKATIVPVVDRPAKREDIAVVDYNGKLANGDDISGAKAEDFEIELTAGKFISDLIDGIVGMSIGETKNVEVVFPEAYQIEELAGETAAFNVVLKDLKEPELPALDDDFAKEVSDLETMVAYRESIETRFKEQAKLGTDRNIRQSIETALVDVASVDLPETLIEQETSNIINQMANQFKQYGMDINQIFNRETIPGMKETCRPDAVKNLTRELAIAKIAKTEGISVSDEEIVVKMSEILPQLAGEKNIDEQRLRAFIVDDLQKEKTLDWLKERAQVELVPEGSLTLPEAAQTETETTAAE
jgi:trigger factor